MRRLSANSDFYRVRSGMTLIELLVVIAILSLLAAIVLPSFKAVLVERKGSVAALEVKGILEAARSRAIARGRPVSVVLERLSSRWDGVSESPRLSVTASNSPANMEENYSQYNSCIRLTIAEATLPILFEGVTVSRAVLNNTPPAVNDEAFLGGNGLPNTYVAGEFADNPTNSTTDSYTEFDRIVMIANVDPRLQLNLVAGNKIELINQDKVMSYTITAPSNSSYHPNFASGTNLCIAIANEGDSTYPFGTNTDINVTASAQRTLQAHRPFLGPGDVSSSMDIRVYGRPRPIASTVNELPRGTCIDLSLSGLGSDDSNVAGVRPQRDCQREFASDWIWLSNNPTPQEMRPVYITFGPRGTLTSVTCNGPGSSELRTVEPNENVFLFVGRTDQISSSLTAAAMGTAVNQGLKVNLMDATSYWVKISPTGAIAAAPNQASHIVEDVESAMAGNSADDLSEMVTESRVLSYVSELSGQ